MKLKAKLEQRVDKEHKFETLVAAAAGRELTTEEQTELDTLEREIETLDKEITSLEAIEERAKKIAKRKMEARASGDQSLNPNASEEREASKFMFAKAFKSIHAKKPVEGLEREIYDEAVREAESTGQSISGNIAIPSRFIKFKGEKRLLDVATEGTDVVFTEYGGLIPILNPDPVATRMGITVLRGLNGNVQWPRHNGDVAFGWETETSDLNETTPTFDNISISPKRVGGYVDVSMQMLKQSIFVMEPWLRNILSNRYALTVDTALINGQGGNEPTGILNYAGVNNVSLGSGSANGITYAAVLEMIRAVKAANTRTGSQGWIMNSDGQFALARTPKQTNGVEGNFILDPEKTTLIGRRFEVSEQVPSNLSEGGQTDLSALIYSSNWSSAILGMWGGFEMLFDPYTQAVGGKVRFVCNAFLDIEFEHAEEFSMIKDWDASDLPAIT